MTDFSFRDALLKQNGETPVDAQLKVLDDMVTADRRYVRRLTIWTIAVWATWVAMMAIGLGLPMVLAATAPRTAGPPQEPVTATTTTQMPSKSGGSMGVVATILVVAVLAVFYSLPIAGVILLVMMIAARRSATVSQIQASLASIDAQLKLILSQKTSSTNP
jgi:hypothetical protein